MPERGSEVMALSPDKIADLTGSQLLENLEVRGWKEICAFLRVKDKRTARRRLDRMGLLIYEGRKPVLMKWLYNRESLRLYLKDRG